LNSSLKGPSALCVLRATGLKINTWIQFHVFGFN
jgi:hypothetical protein